MIAAMQVKSSALVHFKICTRRILNFRKINIHTKPHTNSLESDLQEDKITSRLHVIAEEILKKEVDAISNEPDRLAILRGITKRETWQKLRENKSYDENNPAVGYLWSKRSELYDEDSLEKTLYEWKIIPEFVQEWIRPKVISEINFKNGEKCENGVEIDPLLSINSPQIFLRSLNKPQRYVTIMLFNLDRPNTQTGYYEEFCHWMITDIYLKDTLSIPAAGVCFDERRDKILSEIRNNFKIPEIISDKITTGNVVIPFLPFHPARRAPNAPSRYVLAVFEQKSQKSGISLDILQEMHSEELQKVESNYEDMLQTFPQLLEQIENEKHLLFPVRSSVLCRNLAEKFGLELVSVNLNVCSYTPAVSEVFNLLGVREPVYMEDYVFPNKEVLLSKINNSMRNIQRISKMSFPEQIPRPFLEAINSGSKLSLPTKKIPTKIGLLLEELRTLNQIKREQKMNVEKNASSNPVLLSPIALAALIKMRRLERKSSMQAHIEGNPLKSMLNPLLENPPSLLLKNKQKVFKEQHYLISPKA